MKSRTERIVVFGTILVMLLIGPLYLKSVFAQEYVTGTQDDTLGVWMFNAGKNLPAEEPTDDIIERAVFYDILDYIGDSAEEVYDFGWGLVEPTLGQEDTTLAEVIEGLSAIDDFGYLSNGNDDQANFDTGSDGYFFGGFDPDDPYVIVADGVKATGVLGPSGATSKEKAEKAIDGYEFFIFEDAELSGMTVTLSNYLGLSITFSLADLQVDPPTQNAADDALIAIDLDNLVDFDGTFIDAIRIEDDGIRQSRTNTGDTTLEIDAIAVRKSLKRCVPYIPAPQRLWTTDILGLGEIDEFSIGGSVYLKTSDDYVGQPLVPGKYRVWLFQGNFIPVDGDVIPDDFGTPVGLTPLEVTTTSEGRFDVVKIWEIPYDPMLICNDYTVILDQIELADGSSAPNQGVWGDEDYRDDLCTATPTPPSFHVIPEVVLGTILALVGMFGGLGVFMVRRKKKQALK